MSRIEIWKSKPAWRALSSHERRVFVQELRMLMEERRQNELDDEPYIISKKEGDLLLWTSDQDENKLTELSVIDFQGYFELLCTVSVTDKLNAQKLAQKLSQ